MYASSLQSRALWLAALLIGIAAPRAALGEPPTAEPIAVRPEAARRLVREWTFEERPGNVEPVPRDWYRNQHNPPTAPRPGFPVWNAAGFDDTLAYRGQTSVKLPTRGGSTALTLSRGVVPAMPGGRYQLTAMARTQGLTYARAYLKFWLLDSRLQPLPGAEAVSAPIETGGEWRPVEAMLDGRDDAAWVQIELNLLQPVHARSRGKHEVGEQDFSGAAWFDDVRLFQVPLVDLNPTQAAAVEPETPELRLRVQDLTGERLTAVVSVRDIDDREVASFSAPVESGGRTTSWKPALPAFGWYRAELTVDGPGGAVARRSTRFVWLPAPLPVESTSRHTWGLIAEDVAASQLPMLPALIDATATGSLSLPVWSHIGAGEADAETSLKAETAVSALLERRQELTFVLGHIPERMAREARIDADDPLPLLAGPDTAWTDQVSPLLSRYGERVQRWQIGPTGSEGALRRTALADDLRAVAKGFRGLVPRPVMTVPWLLDRAVAAARGVDAVTIVVPANISDESIPQYAPQWLSPSSASVPEATLVITPPSPDDYGQRSSVEAVVRRAVSAWGAGVPRLAIQLPWTMPASPEAPGIAGAQQDSGIPDSARTQALPDALVPVWRTIAQHLSGRIPTGLLPVVPGVQAWLAQGTDSGAVIAWNLRADPKFAALKGYVGPGPVRVTDIFGNAVPFASGPGGTVDIKLGASPLFIEGVDVNLLRLRAGLRVVPPNLPARAERHALSIEITNPWHFPVAGSLRLAQPEEWNMSPRVIPFALQANETQRYPFNVSLGAGEQAGTRSVIAELEFTGERRYPSIKVELPVEIGLETIQMIPSYRYIRGERGDMSDLLITLLVTNLDSKPVTLEAFVRAPGLRGQQAPISGLAPGESAVRRFIFGGVAQSLRGQQVLTGLKELGGTGRLNIPLSIQ